MYTLVVNENNEIITTVKERIMQRSKLVDTLHFLVDPTYKGHDMSTFTAKLDYLLPISKEAVSDTLVMSTEMYKDKLEYKLPIDTSLTKEAGKIELNLTFVKLDMDSEGNVIQRVRKAGPASITIIPLSAWTNVVPDGALNAIDQRLIMAEAMINAANDFNQYLYENKADNIVLNKETNTVQLTSNGQPIGNAIEYSSCGIKSFDVDENDNITITLFDGRVLDLGQIVGASGATFTPHLDEKKILTWTCDKDLPVPDPVDLNPFDEWSNLGDDGEASSQYMWEFV